MQSALPPWDDLRILLAVHRGKSFLAAGKALAVATSTVARRVDALEQAMGRTLVQRGSGGATIDPDGMPLVALAEQMSLGLAALQRDGGAAHVDGTVRVSVSDGFVRPVTRVMARLRVQHPGLSLELVAESRLADIARREVDIGIRVVRSSSASLIEKSLGQLSVALFASRAYVERRIPGRRLRREQAEQHDWLGFDRSLDSMPHERWMRAYGAKRFVFRSTAAAAIEEGIVAGMGIGLLGEAHGNTLDGLVRLETDEAPPTVPVYLAVHRDGRKTPRVRVVVRELELEIRRALA
jgi:DNA-binding transcriptional LysR family regulator